MWSLLCAGWFMEEIATSILWRNTLWTLLNSDKVQFLKSAVLDEPQSELTK